MKGSFLVILMAMGLITIMGMLHPQVSAVQFRVGHQQILRTGKIEGRVIDAEGKPASKFTVFADKDNTERGRIYNTRTDKDGFFLIEGVLIGTYTVYAGRESAGYPESISTLYLDAVMRQVKVEVNEEQTTPQSTVLKLGPKLGILTGRIEDAFTKKSVTNAQVTLRLVDIPTSFFSTNVDEKGRFKYVAPPAPFTIEVLAPGYEDWRLSGKDPDQPTKPLQVASGGVKDLAISLQPVKQP